MDTLPSPATGDVSWEELQAEIARLHKALREAVREKDQALLLLRRLNADLASQVRGQTAQLASVNQLIRTISGSLDTHTVATSAINGLQALMQVQAVSLALVDSAGEIRYVMGQPPEVMPALTKFRLRLGQGIVGHVIQTGRSFLSNHVQNEPGFFGEVDRVTGFETQSVLCEPLIIQDRVIGAVELINKRSGPFTDSDRPFVETVAGALAIAVENAHMYEQVRTQLRDLERTHQELLDAQAELVQSEKLASIGQLTAGLAHEINNPIGTILGLSELIAQHADNGKVRSYAASIEREAMRVKLIVSDLLDFARRAQPEPGQIDLRATLDKTLSLVEYQLEKDNIRVNRMYAPEPTWAVADGNQMIQVLMNLIQNARQAMPHGGELTCRTWSEGYTSLLSVADTGMGIPEADLEHIFDPFFTTKPAGQGTGLGLSVSYGIIARHHGNIHVTSRPGAGTTFTVRLPSTTKVPPFTTPDIET
jgi:signal transduction histidine kinase